MSEETFCYSKHSYVSDDDITFPTTRVLNAMKSNLNVKHLQFQYIGLKNGLFINYPSTRLRDCDSYDPRLRYMNKCTLCHNIYICKCFSLYYTVCAIRYYSGITSAWVKQSKKKHELTRSLVFLCNQTNFLILKDTWGQNRNRNIKDIICFFCV